MLESFLHWLVRGGEFHRVWLEFFLGFLFECQRGPQIPFPRYPASSDQSFRFFDLWGSDWDFRTLLFQVSLWDWEMMNADSTALFFSRLREIHTFKQSLRFKMDWKQSEMKKIEVWFLLFLLSIQMARSSEYELWDWDANIVQRKVRYVLRYPKLFLPFG